jgi:Mg-chelatase subunit ChlD
MGFLVPALLAGLAALGIPLLLHLRQRDRQRPMPFPSLMFLRRVPIRTDRRRRITDLPLLLLRALAVALLVLAFARPYLRSALPGEGATAGLTVLVVDRSQSMAHLEVQSAVRDSLEAILSARPAARRMAIIGYDQEAEVLAAPTTDAAMLRDAAARATPRAAGTQSSAGWRVAGQLLAGEALPGEVLWITDGQRSTTSEDDTARWPTGTRFRHIEVRAASPDNSAVVAVEWQPVESRVGREGVVAAQLVRSGGEAERSAMATLLVDGRAADSARVVLPGSGTIRVPFPSVALPRTAARIAVRLDADALPADDIFHAVVPAETGMRVALVSASAAEGRYLEGALGLGRDPVMTIERVTAITPALLARSAVVWFHDVPPPGGAEAGALDAWVRGGGGIVTSVGPRMAAVRAPLPGMPAELRGEAAREGAVVGEAALAHPALAPFRGERQDPLATVRTRRQPLLAPHAGASTILAFDDGLPALVVDSAGAGHVAVLAVPLEVSGGDFPLQPSFLPFVRGLAAWAGGRAADPVAMQPGGVWRLPGGMANPVVRSPAGELPAVTTGLVVLPSEAGVFEAFEGEPAGAAVALMAVNAPAAEADLRPSPEAADAPQAVEASGAAALALGTPSPTEREARQGVWRWLLLLAVAVLGVEALVASRGWRGVAPAGTISGGDVA